MVIAPTLMPAIEKLKLAWSAAASDGRARSDPNATRRARRSMAATGERGRDRRPGVCQTGGRGKAGGIDACVTRAPRRWPGASPPATAGRSPAPSPSSSSSRARPPRRRARPPRRAARAAAPFAARRPDRHPRRRQVELRREPRPEADRRRPPARRPRRRPLLGPLGRLDPRRQDPDGAARPRPRRLHPPVARARPRSAASPAAPARPSASSRPGAPRSCSSRPSASASPRPWSPR